MVRSNRYISALMHKQLGQKIGDCVHWTKVSEVLPDSTVWLESAVNGAVWSLRPPALADLDVRFRDRYLRFGSLAALEDSSSQTRRMSGTKVSLNTMVLWRLLRFM